MSAYTLFRRQMTYPYPCNKINECMYNNSKAAYLLGLEVYVATIPVRAIISYKGLMLPFVLAACLAVCQRCQWSSCFRQWRCQQPFHPSVSYVAEAHILCQVRLILVACNGTVTIPIGGTGHQRAASTPRLLAYSDLNDTQAFVACYAIALADHPFCYHSLEQREQDDSHTPLMGQA